MGPAPGQHRVEEESGIVLSATAWELVGDSWIEEGRGMSWSVQVSEVFALWVQERATLTRHRTPSWCLQPLAVVKPGTPLV